MRRKNISLGHSFHNECIAKYWVGDRFIFVYKCWSGDSPEDDDSLFYDLFDVHGFCLNEGDPWMDDGKGPPSYDEVADAFG